MYNNPINMPDELYQNILSALKKEVALKGKMLFAIVPRFLQQNFNISYKEYSNGESFETWLLNAFPIKRVDLLNFAFDEFQTDRPTIDALPEKLRKCAEAFYKCIKAEGYVYLAEFPTKLKDVLEELNITFAELTDGRKMSLWLESWATPFFELFDNNQRIKLRENAVMKSIEKQEDEIKQMHSFAVSWWSDHIKYFKRQGDDRFTADDVKIQVSHRFAKILLGIEGQLYCALEDELPRIAFDTGLKSKEGLTVFCVLEKNKLNTDGKRQPWAMAGLVCTGDAENPLWNWLSQKFPYVSINRQAVKDSVQDTENILEELEGIRELLAKMTADIAGSIENGITLPENAFSLIKKYHKGWIELQKSIDGNPAIEGEFDSIEKVREQLCSFKDRKKEFDEVLDRLTALCDGTQQLFETLSLPFIKDVATTSKDKEIIDGIRGEGVVDTDTVKTLMDLLSNYESLRGIAYAENIAGADKAYDIFSKHFDEIRSVDVVRFLINLPQEMREFLSCTDSIKESIIALTIPAEQEEEIALTADMLLEMLENKVKNYQLDTSLLLARHIPQNELERALSQGSLAKAEELIQNQEFMQGAGYDPRRCTEYLQKLSALPAELSQLTFLNAAERILAVLDKEGYGAAEKYLLVAIGSHFDKSFEKLLTIYKDSGNKASFMRLVDCFKDAKLSYEHKAYFIELLCDGGFDLLFKYLSANVALIYDRELLGRLIEILPGDTPETKRRQLEDIYALLEQTKEENDFEKLAAEGDRLALIEYIGTGDALSALGYSAEEIGHATVILTDEIPQGNTDFDKANRIYALQGNKNRIAEKLYHRALREMQSGSVTAVAEKLTDILVQEQRWYEIGLLYNCFAADCSSSAFCRTAYMASIMELGEAGIKNFVYNNFTDWLRAMLSQLPDNAELKIQQKTAELKETDLQSFFEGLETIKESLSDGFVKSIALIDSDLRGFVSHRESLISAGLSHAQADVCAITFKTDSFTHERSVIACAERICSFVGNLGNIAENIAIFACDYDTKAAYFLWDIYSKEGSSKKTELLLKYDFLKAAYKSEYRKALLKIKNYAELQSELQNEQNPDSQDGILTAIVKLHIGMDYSLSETEFDFENTESFIIKELIGAMLGAAKPEMISQLICENLAKMLEVQSAATVKDILDLDTAVLENVQAAAIDMKKPEAAIFIYNHFGIGDLADYADSYFDVAISDASTTGSEQSAQIISMLGALYPDKEELESEAVKLKVITILEGGEVSDEELEDIGNKLADISLSESALAELLCHFENINISLSETLCISLSRLCVQCNMQQKYIDLLTCIEEQFEIPKTNYFYHCLCQLYLENMDYLAEDAHRLATAERICKSVFTRTKSSFAAFCLYWIYKKGKNMTAAAFALHFLNEKDETELGNVLPEQITAEIDTVFDKVLPSVVKMFGDQFEEKGEEGLVAFFSVANLFDVIPQNAPAPVPYVTNSDTVYTDGEIASILSALGRAPKNAESWLDATKLPSDKMSKTAYVKILLTACNKNTAKKGLWKKCIEFCEINELEDTLLEVLYLFAQKAPTYNEMQYYRELLVKKIASDGEYLSRFCDSELLYKTVELHCKRLKGEYHNATSHAAIKDLSIIAIATQNMGIFRMFWSDYGEVLVTEHGNLCFAIICRLISDGRVPLAKELITILSRTGVSLKYANIVNQLADMDEQEIEIWREKPEIKMLINLILPEGNQPGSDDLNSLSLGCVENGEQQTGAKVLRMLLTDFPTDYGAFNALFILCKEDFEDRLKMLHFALCGLIKNTAGNSQSYYKRTAVDYAKMLAYVNAAVTQMGMREEITAFDGYDFNLSASDYYSTFYSPDTQIDDFCQDAERKLSNRSAEETKTMCSALISWVTNDWHRLFEEYTEKNIPLSELLKEFTYFNDGFVRSLLSFVKNKEETQRDEILEDVKSVPYIANGKEKEQIERLCKIGFEELISADLLRYPVEEWCMFKNIYGITVKPVLHTSAEKALGCAIALGLLADNPVSIFSNYIPRAFTIFEMGLNAEAAALFGALNALKSIPHFRRTVVKALNVKAHYDFEKVEAMMRLSKIFAQDPEIIIKISHPNFNPWSCMNLVLQLLYTKRAGEIETLKSYFSEENQKLADTLLTIIDGDVSDDDKLAVIDEFSGKETSAYLYFFAKIGYNKLQPRYLKSHKAAELLNQKYLELADTHHEYFKDNAPRQLRHTILINDSVDSSALREKAEVKVQPIVKAAEPVVIKSADYSFGLDLEPITESEGLDALQKEYDGIKITKIDAGAERRSKMELSERMYRIVLGDPASVQKRSDYLLRYGVDCYYYYSTPSVMAENKNTANEIIKQLVVVPADSKSAGYKALMQTIRSGALKKLIYNTASEMGLAALVGDYIKNKTAYTNMSILLSDPLEKGCAEALFDIFAMISAGFESFANMREIYVSAREKLGKLGQIWSEINSKLKSLITDEINLIDKKPEFSVTIQNKTASRYDGYISGVITNTGREKANDVVLQAIYNGGNISHQYSLRTLDKGAKAAFEIYYEIEDDAYNLDLEIIVSYAFDNQQQSLPVYKGSLKVAETDFEEIDTKLYTSHTVIDFTCDENGNVVSPNFYGRAAEKRKLHNMFSGSFVNYSSAIIRGIRRAGKTSILHYLIKYIETNCKDAIVVFVDCQGVRNNAVYNIFVDTVLRSISIKYPELCTGERWTQLTENWSLTGASDINPENLDLFYRELKEATGKGLILVIDEIDVLFQHIENTAAEGLDHSLFPALGKLLCSAECAEAIHMVFCGSNQLIRYGFDGGTLNQLFQRFGSNIVEIGKLPFNDMKEMLIKPCENTKIRWTEEALIWTYEFTDGLVWYTKLLANNVLEHIQKRGRCEIYPHDVVISLPSILTDLNFKQIKEGSTTKEWLIIDALQSLTATPTQYIAIDRLLERLEGRITSKETEGIISNLLDLQMIQLQSVSGKRQYKFASALYWHYFRSVSSSFKRVPEMPNVFTQIIEETIDNNEW